MIDGYTNLLKEVEQQNSFECPDLLASPMDSDMRFMSDPKVELDDRDDTHR